MKKKILLLSAFVILVSSLLCFSAFAATYSGECGENARYSVNTSTGVLTISGTGWMDNYDPIMFFETPWYDYADSITSIVVGEGIVGIGQYAFSVCYNAVSVKFPSTLDFIDVGAFQGCSSLKSITIPSNVSGVYGYAFRGCTALENIVIENGVGYFSYGDFAECTALKSITLPESIETIPGNLFEGCTSLTDVIVLGDIEEISDSAFFNCVKLKAAPLTDGLTYIGKSAFGYCSSLQSISIPKNCRIIDAEAFYGCENLTSVTVSDSVTTLGSNAFEMCSSLSSIKLSEKLSTIDSNTFGECTSLTEITIPDSVKTIDVNAFAGCTALKTVNFGNGLEKIGDGAFALCTALKSLSIPSTVKNIASYAFANCTSLESISIPESVNIIGKDDIFFNCQALKVINVTPDSSIVTWCNNYGYSSLLRGISVSKKAVSLTMDENVTLTAKVLGNTSAIKWKSSDNSVAVVVNGIVIPQGVGKATVTAYAPSPEGELSASCEVTVTVSVSSVILSESNITLGLGEEKTLVATVMPEEATNKNVSWTSTDENVITVDENGKITAVGAGNASVYVITEDGSKLASCSVTVVIKVASITLDESYLEMQVGERKTFVTKILPENATNQNVFWTSSNEKVLKIQNGVVTAVGEGTAYIKAITEDGRKIASCVVVVNNGETPCLTVSSVNATKGNTFTATVSIRNNPGFAGLVFEVGYNSDVMELTDVTFNNEYEFGTTNFEDVLNSSHNPVCISIISDSNITTNGALVTLTFKVKENAPEGDYALELLPVGNITNENKDILDFDMISGSVNVSDYVPGDVNGDGTIDTRDAVILAQYLAGWDVEIIEGGADCNADGSITVKDMILLAQYLTKWNVTLG